MARPEAVASGEDGQVLVYLAGLRAFIARRVADRDLVEDLVQESYLRLLARTRENPIRESQAYLFRIASNLLADLHRGGTAVLAAAEPLADDAVSTPPAQEDGRRRDDLQAMLENALDELSPRCRQVFVMRRFDELDTGEVAARLGISHRMVQKHLIAAVNHLYKRLGHRRRGDG
jgi:RNA polymerase sigma-70 factor (ECF subfamily)